MGSVFNRGTRDEPNWYVKFRDRDGVWKKSPSKQPTKTQARRYLTQIEANIADGKVGIQRTENLPRCDVLMREWSATISNRNAPDDRRRLKKHLLPVFGAKQVGEVTLSAVMAWLDAQRASGTPLKEDKAGIGKMKWVPAAEDARAVVGPWLVQRMAERAGPEDLVFPCASRHGRCYRKESTFGPNGIPPKRRG